MIEVVQGVNIMIAILLVGVCVTIYWIFKYDDWYPNPITDSQHTRTMDTRPEDLGSGTE